MYVKNLKQNVSNDVIRICTRNFELNRSITLCVEICTYLFKQKLTE